MYCIKCGRQIEDNAKFCVFCGAQTEQPGQKIAPGVRLEKETVKQENVSQIPEPDHIEEDFVTGSYQIKGKTIMKAASIVALIMYFIPVFSLDYGIWNVGNISLIDLVFGISYGGEEILGFQLGSAIFLLASIGMICGAFKKEKEKGWGKDAAYGFGGIAFGWIFVAICGVYNASGNPVSVGIKLSFYLFILVNFIGMWAGSKVEIQKQYRRAGGTKTEIQVKKEVYKKTILESIGAGIVFIILYFVFNNI